MVHAHRYFKKLSGLVCTVLYTSVKCHVGPHSKEHLQVQLTRTRSTRNAETFQRRLLYQKFYALRTAA